MKNKHSEFQIGNWVVYRIEDNYCKIKSLSPTLILEGVLKEYHSSIDRIDKIKITRDKLQVSGFNVQDNLILIKTFNKEISVALCYSHSGVHKLYKNEIEHCEVEFIHEVQNAYYEITGEQLEVNLYGVSER